MRWRARDETGQAAVELAALAPLLAVLALMAWQAVVVGQAVWLSGGAARAAARATALGADADAAARRVLPHGLGARVSTARSGGDGVVVRLGVPSVVGGLRLATISTRARFAPQGG